MSNEFLIPGSAQEAVTMKRQHPDYQYYAGGTEINRLGSMVEKKGLVSLHGIGENRIEKKNGKIRIGCMVTFQQLVESDIVPEYLKKAALYMGSRTKREMATIGGNLALSRDDSYLAPVLYASKGRLDTVGLSADGSFTMDNIPIREYFSYHDEFRPVLIAAVSVPEEGERFIDSMRFSNTMQSNAHVTAGFGANVDRKGALSDVRIFVASRGSGIQRLMKTENEIEKDLSITEDEVVSLVNKEMEAVDDCFVSSQYKKYISSYAVSELFLKAKGGR